MTGLSSVSQYGTECPPAELQDRQRRGAMARWLYPQVVLADPRAGYGGQCRPDAFLPGRLAVKFLKNDNAGTFREAQQSYHHGLGLFVPAGLLDWCRGQYPVLHLVYEFRSEYWWRLFQLADLRRLAVRSSLWADGRASDGWYFPYDGWSRDDELGRLRFYRWSDSGKLEAYLPGRLARH